MKKRIKFGIMVICGISIVATAVIAMVFYYNILKEQIFSDLEVYAHIIENID